MSKRKATTVLIRGPAKRTLRERDLMLANPVVQQRIENNRAAAMLLRQARMNAMPLQRANPGETGYVDTTYGAIAVNTTGSVTLLATIVQGAGTSQRVGKKIFYKSIQWRLQLAAETTSTVSNNAWIIVYDKRPTGALPVIADFMNSGNPIALNNDDNSGRFQIVHRKDYVLVGNITTPATGLEIISDTGFIKFRREVVYKAAATGAIGDIEQGALYLVLIGSIAAGTADSSFNGGFRIRFTEQ